MPRNASQMNSGAVAMTCGADPASYTPSRIGIAEAISRVPATIPSTAMPFGTSSERYIR